MNAVGSSRHSALDNQKICVESILKNGPEELQRLNHLRDAKIFEGDVLAVPAASVGLSFKEFPENRSGRRRTNRLLFSRLCAGFQRTLGVGGLEQTLKQQLTAGSLKLEGRWKRKRKGFQHAQDKWMPFSSPFTEGFLSSAYGWRWGAFHEGVDVAADQGTPVLASDNGTVTFVGWSGGSAMEIKELIDQVLPGLTDGEKEIIASRLVDFISPLPEAVIVRALKTFLSSHAAASPPDGRVDSTTLLVPQRDEDDHFHVEEVTMKNVTSKEIIDYLGSVSLREVIKEGPPPELGEFLDYPFVLRNGCTYAVKYIHENLEVRVSDLENYRKNRSYHLEASAAGFAVSMMSRASTDPEFRVFQDHPDFKALGGVVSPKSTEAFYKKMKKKEIDLFLPSGHSLGLGDSCRSKESFIPQLTWQRRWVVKFTKFFKKW